MEIKFLNGDIYVPKILGEGGDPQDFMRGGNYPLIINKPQLAPLYTPLLPPQKKISLRGGGNGLHPPPETAYGHRHSNRDYFFIHT